MKTKVLFFVMLLFSYIGGIAQDYSFYGKKINYSNELKKSKCFKSISDVLENPKEVKCLRLVINGDTGDTTEFNKFKSNYHLFVDLRKLIIEDYSFSSKLLLDIDWGRLSKLEYLRIQGVKVVNLNGLEEMQNLKYLSLCGVRLKDFPNVISSVSTLEVLDLSLNYLVNIPEDISKLSKLKELDLSNNCFKDIPNSIAKLTTLEYLDFNNAETRLVYIDGTKMCKNKIENYPICILDSLNSLKVISLYRVNLKSEVKEALKEERKKRKNFKIIF